MHVLVQRRLVGRLLAALVVILVEVRVLEVLVPCVAPLPVWSAMAKT